MEDLANVTKISCPQDIFKVVRDDLAGKEKEYLYLLSLDSKNKLIAKDIITIGTVTETLIHPREIFKQALIRNAVSIALVHNHPSQDIEPSEEDILLTERLTEAGAVMGIPLVDHLIISNADFVSMKALDLFRSSKFVSKGGDK